MDRGSVESADPDRLYPLRNAGHISKMAILKIARMGHPVLRRRAEEVADPRAPEIKRLIADMIETMEDAEGVGLAAPQVHVPLRVIVFHVPQERVAEEDSAPEPVKALINPVIEPAGDERNVSLEGCLSIPGLVGRVPRLKRIRYRGLDVDGRAVERSAEGFHARVVQHECDHIDGLLYPTRMEDLSTLTFTSELGRHGG